MCIYLLNKKVFVGEFFLFFLFKFKWVVFKWFICYFDGISRIFFKCINYIFF